MTDLNTPEEAREFLRLCLTPHRGDPRTAEQLAKILPGWVRERLHVHAPHLADLHAAAERARAAYVDAMTAWIDGTTPEPGPPTN